MAEAKLNVTIGGNSPKFYVKRNEAEDTSTNVGYEEMNKIIKLIYSSEKMKSVEFKNNTLYFIRGNDFFIEKTKKRGANILGRIPSDLETKLKDCGLSIVEVKK